VAFGIALVALSAAIGGRRHLLRNSANRCGHRSFSNGRGKPMWPPFMRGMLGAAKPRLR
jgi:hypothetical protein